MNKVTSSDGISIAFDRLGNGQPVIVVGGQLCDRVGGASPDWMIDVGRQVADALPNGRYEVLEGQEHVVAPEVLAPVLAEFFAR